MISNYEDHHLFSPLHFNLYSFLTGIRLHSTPSPRPLPWLTPAWLRTGNDTPGQRQIVRACWIASSALLLQQ